MKTLFRTALLATAVLAACPANAADFVFDTINSGTVTGSGNGNAFSYTGSNGVRSIGLKVTGWTRGFDGNFTAGELGSFGSNGLGIYQDGERRDGAYHQVDNVNGWEFLVLQFSEAVSLQSATLNVFQLVDRSYTDNDAFVAWNSSALSTAGTLTGAQVRNLFDTRKGGFNSDSTNYTSALQTYSLPLANASNVWILGGSFNGPDGQNDAFKVARLSAAAVPEPATWAMMLVGFGMVAGAARYRRKKTAVSFG